MIRAIILITCLVVVPAIQLFADQAHPRGLLNAQELADGWISLFDGQSLFGWKSDSDVDWHVEHDSIVATTGSVALLRTTAQFGDFQLQLEFQADADTNSGLFLHTNPAPQHPATECYELNIADPKNPFPTGSLVNRQRANSAHVPRTWHRFDVTVEKGHVVARLDGNVTVDYHDPHPLGRGYLGLQHNHGRIAFKNIRLRPLGMSQLLEEDQLAKWQSPADSASEFTINEQGWLHVVGGSGQFESKAQFGDFVLQLQCQTNAVGLNSGLFFRCIPQLKMMGYESQIQNEFLDGDRSRPKDCGTGGIFRRQNARSVVSDDQSWFSKTLIVTGPHVSVWVNGYQVTDWTDTRAPHENPRQGLRLAPGSLMIQGHDPTTDIFFRAISAQEIPKRTRKAAAPAE